MRLNCPNCPAQYEVEAAQIPPAGRDVQCSNCGHTWFAQRNAPAKRAAAPARQGDKGIEAPNVDMPEDTPAPGARLTPEIASILRAEADHERQARMGTVEDTTQDSPEAQDDAPEAPFETAHDPEEPPAEPVETAIEATDNAAAPFADVPDAAPEPVITPPPLPDTAEINASLQDAEPATNTPPAQSGFVKGLLMAALPLLIAALVYIFAAQIGNAIPPLDPAVSGYAAWVDQLRLGFDQTIQRWVTQ